MREFFSQFGKVIDSTVMLDRETGRSKGFGFVSFEDTNVQPFLGFGNLEIDGKLVCYSKDFTCCMYIYFIFIRLMLSLRNLGISETISLMKRLLQLPLVEVLISLKAVAVQLVVVAVL